MWVPHSSIKTDLRACTDTTCVSPCVRVRKSEADGGWGAKLLCTNVYREWVRCGVGREEEGKGRRRVCKHDQMGFSHWATRCLHCWADVKNSTIGFNVFLDADVKKVFARQQYGGSATVKFYVAVPLQYLPTPHGSSMESSKHTGQMCGVHSHTWCPH